jgi:hypothetical protein
VDAGARHGENVARTIKLRMLAIVVLAVVLVVAATVRVL